MLHATKEGTVYICLDQVLGMTRILKQTKKNRQNENGEFQILRHLHHVGLPNIYDIFEDQENYYVVLEHIEGENLHEHISHHGVYDMQEGIRVAKQLLLVVQYLHTLRPKAIIHGDIKPENIMVSEHRTVLIDFASVQTQKGTGNFVSPERLLGVKKSKQSDIYSVGLIIHYLFTGKIKKIFTDDSEMAISNDIKKIVEKCTKRNIKERYEQIGHIINDLEKIELHTKEEKNYQRRQVVAIHGNAQLSGELAYVMAKHHKKEVLLIDCNIYESSLLSLLSKNKCQFYLQDYLYDKSAKLHTLKHNSKLSILPCRANLESYENFTPKLLEDIVMKYERTFDVIIINCADFIYDALCLKSIYLSDCNIYSIKNGVMDIRKYNAIIHFLKSRQQIKVERFAFLQFNQYKGNVRESLTSKAVEAKWLLSIPFSKKRNTLFGIAGNYPEKMEKSMIRRYGRLIKKLAINNNAGN